MKRILSTRWSLIVFIILACVAVTHVARANNVSYTFYEENSPGVGSFGWTVTAPFIISTPVTFSSFNSSFPPAGYQNSSVVISNTYEPVITVTTYFLPLFGGIFDSNITGITGGPISVPGQYSGIYNGGITRATLSVYFSDLPSTIPEPNTCLLLGTGLLALVGFSLKKAFT
jgi:hypothetical protein